MHGFAGPHSQVRYTDHQFIMQMHGSDCAERDDRVTSTEFRAPTFLILAALASEPQHGYGIKQIVDAHAHDGYRVGTGTVYAALERLESEGLVAHAGAEVVNGRRRSYYELTDSGATALAEQAQKLREVAAMAEGRLQARQGR